MPRGMRLGGMTLVIEELRHFLLLIELVTASTWLNRFSSTAIEFCCMLAQGPKRPAAFSRSGSPGLPPWHFGQLRTWMSVPFEPYSWAQAWHFRR